MCPGLCTNLKGDLTEIRLKNAAVDALLSIYVVVLGDCFACKKRTSLFCCSRVSILTRSNSTQEDEGCMQILCSVNFF